MLKRLKSFENDAPKVYLVATPIGNLNEVSPRTIEVLNEVDIIAAEDTRNSIKLLNHFNIQTKLIAHHQYNEKQSSKGILELLEQGKSVALISDAGYPLISDPGSYLAQEVIEAGYPLIPVSGANAMLNALVCSGLSSEHFMFYGFLDAHENQRKKELNKLKDFPYTMVFYEAPHRIEKMLTSLLEVFGDRHIVLARELTKRHEEFIHGTISEILTICDTLKGEMVVIVEGKCDDEVVIDDQSLIAMIDEYINQGNSIKQACKLLAQEYNLSKNELYNLYHKK